MLRNFAPQPEAFIFRIALVGPSTAGGSALIDGPDWRNRSFRLGDFNIDPRRNRVAGADGEISLQPKVMDVLCTLAAHHGEVLSRTDLIDLVWGKEFGADESLTRAISQLRRAFSDMREVPGIIETIPKRGYRLIASPELVSDSGHKQARAS